MNICQNIPKIELHCHLDGSVRPSTLLELSLAAGLIDSAAISTFDQYIHVPADCQSLVDYLKCFNLPLQLMQTTEALTRIAEELIEDVSKSNVKYIEVRFAPQLHVLQGLTFEAIVESVLTGLERGSQKYGTQSNLILCCMRHMPLDKSLEVIEKGAPYLGRGVVAVDLAGDEAHYPPELFIPAFERAKELGYKITIHAGETGIGKNVTTAIQLLHADRIGHGLFIKDDPEAFEVVKRSHIPLEMCPTSNVQTHGVDHYSDHPILRFLHEDIISTLNTDNMTVSDITLDNECARLSEDLGADSRDIWSLYKNAIEASFASENTKACLRTFIAE